MEAELEKLSSGELIELYKNILEFNSFLEKENLQGENGEDE